MTIERLKKSKQESEERARRQAQERQEAAGLIHGRGSADGRQWALDHAEYDVLVRLKVLEPSSNSDNRARPNTPSTVTEFVRLILPNHSAMEFWATLGKKPSDPDVNSTAYWNGFIEGALAVLDEVEADDL